MAPKTRQSKIMTKKASSKKIAHPKNKDQLNVNRFVYWAPRILAILFILFLMMFSLDVFGMGEGFWRTLGAFLMHNIFSFILIAVLIIGWKRESLPGVVFIIFGCWYIFRLILTALSSRFEWYFVSWSIIIAGPAFLTGILFLVNWKKRRSTKKK